MNASAGTATESHGGLGGFLALLLELTKARITSFVTLSVATGYVLFAGQLDTGILAPILGVFVLACGSAALNQVQEAKLDARMQRTRSRPIPSGRIAADWALFVALAFVGAGLTILASIESHTLTVLALGVLAVVWYNGVYLWLKRATAFAVVPGSLVGAIPPVIGWCAAGGVATDPRILEVAFFFFLWQIPHFWLLLLLFGRDYEEAGLPTLTRTFAQDQLRRITFAWILAVAATGLVLAARQGFPVPWNLIALVASLWLVLSSFAILRSQDERRATVSAFLRINVYAAAMMALLMASALVA